MSQGYEKLVLDVDMNMEVDVAETESPALQSPPLFRSLVCS